MLHLEPFHTGMDQSCTYTRYEIEDQELLRAPPFFQNAAEEIKGVHIEEEVPEAAMHEHMGHRLPPAEEIRGRIEKGEVLVHEVLIERCHDHYEDIDDDDMPDCNRHIAKESSSVAVV
jgi:hypothetical protein